MVRKFILFSPFFLLLAGFVQPEEGRPFGHAPQGITGPDTLFYIFAGHTYDWQSGGVETDPRLEELDYSRFDAVMLGGDVCSEAFQDYRTVEYIDNLFDLGNAHTYYVMGNHDARNENLEWYTEFTGRKTYFTQYSAGITVVVLNTTLNPGDCERLDAQFEMLQNVCDTIQASSHLLILQHHGTWKDVPGLPSSPWDYANWPLLHFNTTCTTWPSTYATTVYPLLQQVQARGVQVVNVMGDGGVRTKSVEMTTPDGIHYLSSGINNSKFANDSLALDTVPK
ncbi:MAG: metallophosphoesterase, partial [Bacteroidota bacterium]